MASVLDVGNLLNPDIVTIVTSLSTKHLESFSTVCRVAQSICSDEGVAYSVITFKAVFNELHFSCARHLTTGHDK